MFDYDAELVGYQARLSAAADVGSADRVLDIGCGAGQATRAAAGEAVAGSACGVDVSGQMLARARRLAARERIRNVSFMSADAQVHPFPPKHFSLGISRFGTMFFTDPVAAFANIARALCSGGRLVQLIWQASERQEWYGAIAAALAGRPPEQSFGGAFSLADPARTASVLTAAGFTAVDITEVREPICYGPDADSALDAVLGLRVASDRLANLAAADAARARGRLRATLDAHDTGDGVWFDSRAWLVTAHRC